jgi:hypothetical protein
MTSIEWLINELHKKQYGDCADLSYNQMFDKAKEMHKKEIISAVSAGYDYNDEGYVRWMGEQYYQETFDSRGTDAKDVILGYKTSLDAQMLDKVEPKQETLEEAAESLFPDSSIQKRIFIKGAKWYREQLKSK